MSQKFQSSTKATRVSLYAVAATMVLNGVIWFAVTTKLGGSPGNGKVEGARFFVGGHGEYTEVSEMTYRYCLWHEWTFIAIHILGLIGCCILGMRLNASEPGKRAPQPRR